MERGDLLRKRSAMDTGWSTKTTADRWVGQLSNPHGPTQPLGAEYTRGKKEYISQHT